MPSTNTSPFVSFHYQTPVPGLRNRTRLKRFIGGIFKKENTAAHSVQFIFCTDNFLLDINRRFLQHDYYTDIISFNLADKSQPVEGEIYISIDRVKENAGLLGLSFNQELHRVIFHGILHFCGYKDKTAAEQTMMRKMEDFYLEKYKP